MDSDRLPRRLAAILYADVAGYSRLTGEDEDATHRRLRDYLDLIAKTIESHHGQVMHYAGDAVLAKFDAVVDALSSAVAIQNELKDRNQDLPDERKVQFRIGVNLGDVIEDRGDIYGDGVNVAARLESLGEAGGICISESVHTAIGNKLPLDYEFMGEQQVKNIDKPVRAYRVVLDGSKKKATETSSRSSPSMSDKPSVAVLPLTNMSGDPQQEHFCDGITEDIITALSRSRWYSVTSRNSTFAYKGRSPDVREVAQTLGVGYVLEGSVRRGGDRVRVTAQLIDAETGNHVWADRFNRELEDEFAIQDEIAHRVASILGERIWQDVAKNIGHKRPETYGPYEYAFLGIELVHRLDPDEIARAKSYFLKALELDRDLVPGHLGLGFCYLCDWAFWDDPSGQALDKAHQHALKLQELAPDDAQTYRLLSRVFTAKRMYDEARRCVDRALRINPDDGDIIGNKGLFLMYYGDLQEAVEWFDKVLELHSETPHTVDIMRYWKALAQFSSVDYQTAVATLKGISGLDFVKNMLLAACYAQLDRRDEAKAMSQAILQVRPNLQLSDVGLCDYFRREEDQQHLRDALRKAGLPAGAQEAPALALPDKPSIAVLPFTNMSSDPEQGYFADGMTEDIITALSQMSDLFVVARNSTFAYKGKSVNVQDIARDLGVRYVLEGSVRKSGQRARITAQLIDATDGHHRWAERYDRNLEDIFEVQDEITRNIAIALQVQLSSGEHARIWQAGTRSFEVWQCQVRGVQAYYKFTREGWSEAIECFEKAVAIDPNYVPAWAALGNTHVNAARYGEIADPVTSLQRAEEIAEKLLSEDESQAQGQNLLGNIRITQRRHEDAVAACAKAVELAPNNANHRGSLAHNLVYSGQPRQALQHIKLAIQLSPHYPNWVTDVLILAHYLQGDFELAREVAEDAVARFPDYPNAHINLSGVYSALGLTNEARDMTDKLLRMKPAFSLKKYAKSQAFQEPLDAETWVGHLRKAGLPD